MTTTSRTLSHSHRFVFLLALGATALTACAGAEDDTGEDPAEVGSGDPTAGGPTASAPSSSAPVNAPTPTTPTPSPAATPSAPAPAPAAGDPTMVLDPALCGGIGNGDPCATVGTCAARSCGLADTGARDCVCGTDMLWACGSCMFPMGADQPSILVPPATPLTACEAAAVDKAACTTMGDRCSAADGEVCACWLTNDDGANIWDCDSPPNFW